MFAAMYELSGQMTAAVVFGLGAFLAFTVTAVLVTYLGTRQKPPDGADPD